MLDVIVVGAGPAGSTAAIRLARAGARVLLVDRDAFPRDKLCGDTLNPGAVALLQKLDLAPGPLDHAVPLFGMRVTGPTAEVTARYGHGARALSVRRRELDEWLLAEAIRAGARFESGLVAEHPLLDESATTPVVRGVVFKRANGASLRVPATMTIGADGRRSVLARSLELMTTPFRPRRWAFGAYATGVNRMTDLGEMHIRRRWYVGVAPLPGGLTNVCVVTRRDATAPMQIVRRAIEADAELCDRFGRASFEGAVRVLGPLAADVRVPGAMGIVLAGDAAGFVDPMTGDGMRLAFEGAHLAASEVLRTLETGDFGGAAFRLAAARKRMLGGKLRFNRAMRQISGSPAALAAASWGSRLMPGLVERAIRFAGDVP